MKSLKVLFGMLIAAGLASAMPAASAKRHHKSHSMLMKKGASQATLRLSWRLGQALAGLPEDGAYSNATPKSSVLSTGAHVRQIGYVFLRLPY
jgi:hypothetical protein